MSSYPAFVRSADDRIIGGVAAGIAAQFGVNVFLMRLCVAVISGVMPLFVLLYAALWVLRPVGKVQGVGSKVPQPVQLLFGVAVWAVLLFVVFPSAYFAVSLLPLGAIAVGAVLVWRAWDKNLDAAGGLQERGFVVPVGAGMALVFAGLLLILANWENRAAFVGSMVAAALTFAGMVALSLPLGVRLWQERTARAAQDERAAIASQLHDSVLQTLALIQKRSDDAAEVARLARGQERQLRAWLFDSPVEQESVFLAIDQAVAEVEDLFGVRIDTVKVGEDVVADAAGSAAVGAAREAMMNAAKHSDAESINVFVEHRGSRLEIFVRDRGKGFDVASVAADRHGVAESIVGRVEGVGGKALVKSGAGYGTEVSLSVPVVG